MNGPNVEVFVAGLVVFEDLDIVPMAPMDCGPDGNEGVGIGGRGAEFSLTIVIPLFDFLFRISVVEFNWLVDDCCWLKEMQSLNGF